MGKKFLVAGFEYLAITFGCLLMALSLVLFFIPNNIAPGGVSGIATVIYNMTGFSVGIMTLIINIPLFIIGYITLGLGFGIRTLYATFVLSILIVILETLGLGSLTEDFLLATLYGGILMGLGLGIVFKYRGTTGGTDLAAAIIHKYAPSFSIGIIMVFIDIIIVISAGLVSRNVEISLYSITALFILVKFIDFIQEGLGYAKAFFIISDKTKEIADEILNQMDRGVTGLTGKGMYTGKSKDVLLCVVTRPEVSKLKEIVHSIDERAFVILTDVHEALGEGFKPIRNRE